MNETLPLLNTWGPIIGLLISIALIIFKLHPVYSLMIGALLGGFLGLIGTNVNYDPFVRVINSMVSGTASMIPAVLRIIASGILAGALIFTGSAEKIATSIVKLFGERFSFIAVAISTMIICAVGVFIDISVITVAPIAISIARKVKITKPALLIAMIGGGKAGNIISPNPNTIVTAEAFKISLTDLIIRNIVPALIALLVTLLITFIMLKRGKAKKLFKENEYEYENENEENKIKDTNPKKEINIFQAIAGPITVIVILILRPTANINIDPLIALPLGGIVTILVTGNYKNTIKICTFGLGKVTGIALLLIGTGTIAGIISSSSLQSDIKNLLTLMNLPTFLLAPISGFLLAAATASTTSGTTIASQTFAKTLIDGGVSSISGAAMTHASATILDSLPHGSFFHATGGSVHMEFKERMKLIPFEALIGLSSTITAIIIYLIFH